jgi:acetyl esterase/lipase
MRSLKAGFFPKKPGFFERFVVTSAICIMLAGCATAGLYRDVSAVDEHTTKNTSSFSYQMLKTAVKMSGYKSIYASDVETLKMRVKKINEGKAQVPPKNFYRKFTVTEETLLDRSVFFISPRQNTRQDAAVFFLYGGGFMLGIDFFHWNIIERIVDELSVPVCVPLYPIYPETNPNKVIEFVNESFLRMCVLYPQTLITGLGDSSGACLLLSFCHYLAETGAARLPDMLICVSPAQVVGIDDETLAQMKALDKKDVLISANILENLPVIFNLRDDDLNWFSAPLFGDFSRFPPVTVFGGTDEIFYPLMPAFVKRVRMQGRTACLYTGEGMMHSWPFLPVAAESKNAMNVILEIIRDNHREGE